MLRLATKDDSDTPMAKREDRLSSSHLQRRLLVRGRKRAVKFLEIFEMAWIGRYGPRSHEPFLPARPTEGSGRNG